MNTIELLQNELSKYIDQGICIAFSGGVDSSLLLKAACELGGQREKAVYGVMFDTNLHPGNEVKEAKRIAKECGARFHVIKVNELDNPLILNNPIKRCYYCKKFLFELLREFAKGKSCSYVLDGTNEDDMHTYRPGLQVLEELNVISPLAKLHITKDMVRQMAKKYKISAAGKPSNSCLATRLPYGARLEQGTLSEIEAAEAILKKFGFTIVRLRLHDQIARIEISKEEFPLFFKQYPQIVEALKKFSFTYITLDMEGFRSGSMDL